ncbi:MAG: serine/threonine protein kinase [Labilithrix sp.]|nr:serine/threonine protein kinase [Labilithrix sp.]
MERVEEEQDPLAQRRVGSVLHEKWTLERILGSGGMGAVYAARHRNGARAAVKVLHPELARRPDVRERFLREGYAANRVEHRGAVQVLDDDVVKEGPDEGTAYLVMELLEGESLEDRVERAPLSELELLEISSGVLEVLEAAHEHGVVHRDLKPANLFLAKGEGGATIVKVLDFGLARLEEGRSVTRAGAALGTPSFMAPEQASGRGTEIDARTDLFAVGATAFLLLSGRGVHEAEGVIELVARMGTLPAPKLREVAPQISEDVAAIVDRALMFAREDRWGSAAEMRAEVLAAIAKRRVAATSAGAPTDERAKEEPEKEKKEERATAREDADANAKTQLVEPEPKRSWAWLVALVIVAAGAAIVVQARESASGAVPPASAGSAGSAASAGSPGPPGPALAATGASDEDAGETDDASVLADLDAGDADAGDDDDDDDDDEPDASDVAAITGAGGSREGGAPAAVAAHASPRAKPATPKRPKPRGPKKRWRPWRRGR